jgi:DNA-binding CsgD family transcriptional regulator
MSSQKIREEIKNIEAMARAEPRAARLQILRLIGELTRSSRGLCYCMIQHQNRPYATEPVGFGPPEFMEAIQSIEGRCLEDLLELSDGSRAELLTDDPFFNRTLRVSDVLEVKDIPLYRIFFQPLGIRWLFGRYIIKKGVTKGWIGVYRTLDEPCFSRRDQVRLRTYSDDLFRLLDETMEAGRWKVRPSGMIGMMDEQGEVLQASADAANWFKDGDVCGELREAAREFLQGEDHQRKLFVRRHAVELHRMVGDESQSAHVRITPTEFLEIPVMATLTPGQRRVAKLLLAGATIGEVSSELDISQETVRSHVKAIYERMGVSNRVELFDALKNT